jgi:hypothetical protein
MPSTSKRGRVGRSRGGARVKSPAGSRSAARSWPGQRPGREPGLGDAPRVGSIAPTRAARSCWCRRMAATAEGRPAQWRPLDDPGAWSSATTSSAAAGAAGCQAWRDPSAASPGGRSPAYSRGLVAGDVVSIAGALRRRFWRAGAGAVSRCGRGHDCQSASAEPHAEAHIPQFAGAP